MNDTQPITEATQAEARAWTTDLAAAQRSFAELEDQLRGRITQLQQLAADMLGRFHGSGDGHRARVGQVQVAKWQAVLRGDDD